MCHCKRNGGGALEASISAAETKIPQLKSNIKSSEEQEAQLEGELKQAQTVAVQKTAIGDATAARKTSCCIRSRKSR